MSRLMIMRRSGSEPSNLVINSSRISTESPAQLIVEKRVPPHPAHLYLPLKWGKLQFEIGDRVQLLSTDRLMNYSPNMEGQIYSVSEIKPYAEVPRCRCGTYNINRHTRDCASRSRHSQWLFLTDLQTGEYVVERDAKGYISNGRYYAGDFVWVPNI